MTTPPPVDRSIRVALLGAGTVGSQTARILMEDADLLATRTGARLELTGVYVRRLEAERDYQLPAAMYTTDAEGLIESADIVIELMGGLEPARSLILKAFEKGASVVTGNKALLATHGAELFQAAAQAGVQLSFEASVGGAIPILRPLSDSLSGDRVQRVMGIVNGTTNYILDQMDSTGAKFDDALQAAQELGYAEADPTADVEGHDAAAKAAILAGLSFQAGFSMDQVFCEGITSITDDATQAATGAGYVIKLLAIAERLTNAEGVDGAVLRVHPTLLPRRHPLATVRGAFNAVFVEAENAGELMFYGPGAGGAPTASAVMGDTVSIASRLVLGGTGRTHVAKTVLPALPIGDSTTSYMIVVRAADQPGVLATVANLFGEHGVSIESMHQSQINSEDVNGGEALLRFITHRGQESKLSATVAAIENLDVITAVVSVLRVEGN